MTGLSSTYNKGFSLTFENGLTISVQFGYENYCSRKNDSGFSCDIWKSDQPIIKSMDAEIAIWDAHNNWYDFGNDTVTGWVNPDEIAKWIYVVSKAKSLEDVHELMNHVDIVFKY